MLGYLQLVRAGRASVDAAFIEHVSNAVSSENVHPAVRVTAVALAGEYRLQALMPHVRIYAKNEEVHLRRAALRCLGRIGSFEDEPIFQSALASGNELVMVAARAGLADMLRRIRADGTSILPSKVL